MMDAFHDCMRVPTCIVLTSSQFSNTLPGRKRCQWLQTAAVVHGQPRSGGTGTLLLFHPEILTCWHSK